MVEYLTPQRALEIFEQQQRPFPPQGDVEELDLVDLFAMQRSDDVVLREIGQRELRRRGIATTPTLPTPLPPETPFPDVPSSRQLTPEQRRVGRAQTLAANEQNRELRSEVEKIEAARQRLQEEIVGLGVGPRVTLPSGEPVTGTGAGVQQVIQELNLATVEGPGQVLAPTGDTPLPAHATPHVQAPPSIERFVPNRGFLGGGAQQSVFSEMLRGLGDPIEQTSGVEFTIRPTETDQGQQTDEAAGFVRSAMSAFGPESIGIEPSEDVQRYRAENPGSGFVSQMLGDIPAFALGSLIIPASTALRLPVLGTRFARGLKAAKAIENPLLRGAASEFVRFTPFEAIGVGGALAFEGLDSAQEELKEAALNLGLIGVAGSFLGPEGALAATLPGAPRAIRPLKPHRSEELIQRRLPEYDIHAPRQDKLKQLITFRETAEGEEVLKTQVAAVIERLKKEVQLEVPRPGVQAVVGKLAVGGKPGPLNRLLSGGRDKGVRHMTEGQGVGFRLKEKELFEEAQRRANLPPDWEAFTQFYRAVEAKSPEASKRIRDALESSLVQVEGTPARSVYLGREQESGLYVVARKLKGRVREGRKGDLFDIFRTDNPALFFPEGARFARDVQRMSFALKPGPAITKLERSIPVARDIVDTKKALPPAAPLAGAEPNRIASVIRESLPGEMGSQVLDLSDYLKVGLKKFLAPTTAKFTDSPRAMNLAQIIRTTFTRANARAAAIFSGERLRPKDSNLIRELFRQPKRVGTEVGAESVGPRLRGGIEPFIERLNTEEHLTQFTQAVIEGLAPEDALRLGFKREVVELLNKLEKVDRDMVRQIEATNAVIGVENFSALAQHYMISRLWRGGLRLELRELTESGAPGKVVGYASGRTPKKVVEEAQALATKVRDDEGIKLTFDRAQIKQAGKDTDLDLARRIAIDTEASKAIRRARSRLFREHVLEPQRFQERRGARGFAGELQPLTQEEIKSAVFGNLVESHRYMAENLLRKRFLQEELQTLHKDFPAMGEEILRLIELSAGRRTEALRRIEEPINKMLAPFLGGNAAANIARGVNQAMFTLTLGAGDIGFPILNAMTFVQTVLPEIAMVTRAPTRDLMKYYSWDLVRRGRGLDTIGTINPLKLATRAMKDIIHADDEMKALFKGLVDEGAVAPRFIEDFLGETSRLANFKRVIRGEEPFVQWLDAANKWMPSRSEEFARLHAAAVGRRLGKDFLGLEGNALLQFSKQFTERTMFNYGTADRAALMTGAFGSLFGLFKNWSVHYLSNFAQYTSQGFARGNWAPLLWAMAGTSSVAGVSGVPLFFAAEGMSRLFTDKTLMENLYGFMGYDSEDQDLLGVAGGKVVDSLYYGLPAFLNVSLSARAGAPGADAVRDLNTLVSVATLDRMQALSQFLGDASDAWFTAGQHPSNSRKVFDQFMRFAAPRTVYRFYQSTANDAIRSLRTGNQLIDNVSLLEKLQFSLGVAPLRVQKAFDVSSELWRDEQTLREGVSVLGEEYAEALEQNDTATLQNLIFRATARNIPLANVVASGQANYLNRNVDQLDRQFKTYRAEKLREITGLNE